jgi:acyl-CoA hydrolase
MNETISTRHLIKGEDLNHHGTLYAGRGVEWMVEAGFLAASNAVENENIVCMRINSLLFRKPVPKGQIVNYESRIVFTGRTSLTAYVRVLNSHTGEFIVDGFFTYVYVTEDGKPAEHGIIIEPASEIQQELYDEAKALMIEAKEEAKKAKMRNR